MLLSILLVDFSYLRHEWIIRVRICEQGADGKQNFGNSKGRAPVVFQDVQANTAFIVHIAMVDLGQEFDLWCNNKMISLKNGGGGLDVWTTVQTNKGL